jgi:DNA-binding response OmpR family regulator
MPGPILIVDDDPAILGALTTIMSLCSHCCRTAPNGKEALEAALTEEPSLILLDFHLPGMTGSEVLQQLRAAGVAAPAVLMSAAVTDLEQEARDHGFDAVLPKPFALAQVIALVDRFVLANAA